MANFHTLCHIQRVCNGIKGCIQKFMDVMEGLPQRTGHWNFLLHFPMKDDFFLRVIFEEEGRNDQMNSPDLLLIRPSKPLIVLEPVPFPTDVEPKNFSRASLFWYVDELFYNDFRLSIGSPTKNGDAGPSVAPGIIFPRTIPSAAVSAIRALESEKNVDIPKPYAWKKTHKSKGKPEPRLRPATRRKKKKN